MKDETTVPLWELPIRRECSTFLFFLAPAAYELLIPAGVFAFTLARSGFLPAVWIAAAGLAAALLIKWRLSDFAAEDGIYLVRNFRAVRIPWEKVRGAKFERVTRPMASIRVDFLDSLTDAQRAALGTDILRFPYRRRAGECFLRHVPVQKTAGWEAGRRMRAGKK